MNKKIDWQIHIVSNHAPCVVCGKQEDAFMDGFCDAHTHGMNLYRHPEFQLVLEYSQQEIMRILNTFGCMVRDGKKFHDKELVEGIFLDCPVRLEKHIEKGETLLRVVVPDRNNVFPEGKGCEYPYSLQHLGTSCLYKRRSTLS